MSRHRPDPQISRRTVEELLSQDKTVSEQLLQLGLSRQSFYNWQLGGCPDARALQALCAGGYDVHYILTGRRNMKHEL